MSLADAANERPAVMWLAHHRLALTVSCLVISVFETVAFYAVGPHGLPYHAQMIAGLTGAACNFAWFGGMAASIRHFELLCTTCLDRVPDDAPVQVKRKDRALRFVHWSRRRIGLVGIGVLVTVIAADLVDALAWLAVPLWALFVFDEWAVQFHARVVPWCPYCRGGGGGPREASPTPDPVGVKTA